MKQQVRLCTVAFLLLTACTTTSIHRESVLDEVVTIQEEIFYDVPDVTRWCDRLGIEGLHISIGDAQLYVETEGEGIPLVLLHGGPGGTHHYFHPHFSRAVEFSQVIYYDQRGCGLSDYESGKKYTIQQAAYDLESLRTALDLGEWVVLGHSYGGLLAQVYATMYPDNVAGLILVGSAISPNILLEPTRQYDYLSEEELLRIHEISEMSDLSTEQRLYNRFLNGDWKRQFYYRPSEERIAALALYEWVHHSVFRSQLWESLRKLDLECAFKGCQIPTLIIEGKWDLTWNKDKPGVIQAQHPNADVLILEHSGHSPFDDEPDVFFSELEHFISSLDK